MKRTDKERIEDVIKPEGKTHRQWMGARAEVQLPKIDSSTSEQEKHIDEEPSPEGKDTRQWQGALTQVRQPKKVGSSTCDRESTSTRNQAGKARTLVNGRGPSRKYGSPNG